MASIIHRKDGHRWIQFVGPTGRRVIRFGKVPDRVAAIAKAHIEDLLTGHPSKTTRVWVAEQPAKIRKRLVTLGLIESTANTLTELTTAYIDSLANAKSTVDTAHHVTWNLLDYFGENCLIRSINEASPRLFHGYMKTRGKRIGKRNGDERGPLSIATASKRMDIAKRIFQFAVDCRWLDSNPFEAIPSRNEINRARDRFIKAELIEELLDIVDVEFSALVALVRYGGLRCPSEVLKMTWDAVDWDRMSICVQSIKTRHHRGRNIRLVPMFPEIHSRLDALWQCVEAGALLFPNHQVTRTAITNKLQRYLRRLGHALWPKPWQNMRTTRETELTEQFPIHVVCSWIGNSPKVAIEHYNQITAEHWASALNLKTAASLLPRPKSEAKSEAPEGSRKLQNLEPRLQ